MRGRFNEVWFPMVFSLLLELQNLQVHWQVARLTAALMAGEKTVPAVGSIKLAYGPASC